MVHTPAVCRHFASAPFTIITYDRTVQYGSPEQLTGNNQSSNAATAPVSERRSSRWDVQPVRHVRPGMSSRRQPVESAVPSAPQQEAAGAPASLASQQLHPQPSATGTAAVGRDDDGDTAAQSAAELSALRRRAMQSVPRHNTHEPASRERYCRRPRAASRSPVSRSGKRRRGHHLTGASAAEPLHRKRHARRHSRTQDSELDTRLAAPVATAVTGCNSDSADSERWVMG
jgi:hypothetical protein